VNIQTDELTRRLYANDASMYEELPVGVVFPSTAEDISELIKKAYLEKFSITPRAAGTSLAGQATGGGVIMDVSPNMNDILQINHEEKWARVQPGVIRDTLNAKTAAHNLFFAADTSTTNRCMIGGMIGNNSSGSFSVKYGTTREHVLEMDVVLSNGDTATFHPLTDAGLTAKMKLDSLEGHIYRNMIRVIQRNRKEILEAWPHPEIKRRNTGYALDKLCDMHPFVPGGRPFNMCELLCGSEGTLAVTTSAKVRLTDISKNRLLIIPQFRDLHEAMLATKEAVKFDVSAVELVDDIILDATKGNIEQEKNRFFLQGEPACILIIQFEGESLDGLKSKAQKLKKTLQSEGLGYAFPVLSAEADMHRVWELRKAGLGLLMGLGKDSRSPTFCEDTAVRVQDLPDYVNDFRELLKRHETRCVFYAHASVGELHLRPVIDITKPEGLQKMKVMAEEIAELVQSYRGSLSGEHGDGRARSPYIPKVLGEEMMPILKEVKEIWDPHYLLNPGKIVNPKAIDDNLRFSPDYRPPEVPTFFHWRKEGGFAEATEMCNGAGVCRKLAESGGTMCPSYMATREEKDSTRGRANLFRQLFSGKQAEAFTSGELKEALDLCLSCKACKSECPANVDMAKMKAEFNYGWQKQKGKTLADRLFGEAGKLYPLASKFSGLSNRMINLAPVKILLEKFAGVDARRNLPVFAPETFMQWWQKRETGYVEEDDRREKVALFIDLFTNYHEPEIGKDAVRVLEGIGFEVLVPDFHESGRPQISRGLLDEAKEICDRLIGQCRPFIEKGIPLVGIDPAELLTFRDEFLDLCDEKDLDSARQLAKNSFLFEEFVVNHKNRLPEVRTSGKPVLFHGHCHAKALAGNEASIHALELTGHRVKELKTGCCGMAGSFGYENSKYEVSMDIGELVLFPALRQKEDGEQVCAPGFSCRHQIKDGVRQEALHPAQLIYRSFSASGLFDEGER